MVQKSIQYTFSCVILNWASSLTSYLNTHTHTHTKAQLSDKALKKPCFNQYRNFNTKLKVRVSLASPSMCLSEVLTICQIDSCQQLNSIPVFFPPPAAWFKSRLLEPLESIRLLEIEGGRRRLQDGTPTLLGLVYHKLSVCTRLVHLPQP